MLCLSRRFSLKWDIIFKKERKKNTLEEPVLVYKFGGVLSLIHVVGVFRNVNLM